MASLVALVEVPVTPAVVDAISLPLLLRLLVLDHVRSEVLHEQEGDQEDKDERDRRERGRAVEPDPDLVDDEDRQRRRRAAGFAAALEQDVGEADAPYVAE